MNALLEFDPPGGVPDSCGKLDGLIIGVKEIADQLLHCTDDEAEGFGCAISALMDRAHDLVKNIHDRHIEVVKAARAHVLPGMTAGERLLVSEEVAPHMEGGEEATEDDGNAGAQEQQDDPFTRAYDKMFDLVYGVQGITFELEGKPEVMRLGAAINTIMERAQTLLSTMEAEYNKLLKTAQAARP